MWRKVSLAAGLTVAIGLTPATAMAMTPRDFVGVNAYYSNSHEVVQSQSINDYLKFIASPQLEYGMQSYCMYGLLSDRNGKQIALSSVWQDNWDDSVPILHSLPITTDAVLYNLGEGIAGGGTQGGVPDVTLPVAWTTRPWSIHTQVNEALQTTCTDFRVVKGRYGRAGAVYEISANLLGGNFATGDPVVATVYIRAKDTMGMAQWGFGPSGFFPQWIYPHQRAVIMDKYSGSVNDYLHATNDPMSGQGSYYYTAPLLKVQSFVITQGGAKVAEGKSGGIRMDAVTQSFDDSALAVTTNGVSWIEFSVSLPESGQAMKIGQVTQKSVQSMPYAMLVDTDGRKARDGAITPSLRWNLDDITFTPIKSSAWVSPRSHETYYMKYKVTLAGKDVAHRASLTFTAAYPDQEISGKRNVYEGLYNFTGTLAGTKVSGTAWAEIQGGDSQPEP